MKRILVWAQGFAISLGGPGLFLVAFLDSSFLSLPEINDILVVWMVMQHKQGLVYYVAMATLGSIAGCFVLYWLAWQGGERLLQKWFKEAHIARASAQVRRHGVLALFVPAILPPPAPFKIFVLLAGVVEIPPLKFVVAIGLARGLRYTVEGLLAVWYGRRALDYIEAHSKGVALGTAAVVLVFGLAYGWWHSRRSSQAA
jgi:membrane protein YqaA with SNARE-associated domain